MENKINYNQLIIYNQDTSIKQLKFSLALFVLSFGNKLWIFFLTQNQDADSNLDTLLKNIEVVLRNHVNKKKKLIIAYYIFRTSKNTSDKFLI